MTKEPPPHSTRGSQAGVPHFFISYSHADATYVKRLAGYLESYGLPAWYDADLPWGARFTQEIRQRITDALAVIVVMSPAAEDSEWVEREILEGQRHDREFLPILLDGNRLFLLATRHFFDARNGDTLPGDREICQLRAIRDGRSAGAGEGPKLVLRPPQRPTSTVHPPMADSMRKLRSLLGEGDIGHADILTSALLLESVQRLEAGWMRRRADGAKLSVDLLADVDALWSTFSGGVQGFQAQLDRYAGPLDGVPAGAERDFSGLAQAFGWKSSRRDTTPRYGAFVEASSSPVGFFPTLRNPQTEQHPSWHDQWVETVMAVHFQLRRRNGG